MLRITRWTIPILLTLVTGASFALPAYPWAVGLPALAGLAVWQVRYAGRQRAILTEQEERHDRRRQLLSTLAHEVRTPLTVIRSSSTILMDEERCGALSDEQRRFVGSIYGNAQRLEALTENILAGLKIESWSDSLRLRPVDLRKEVISVTRSLEPALAVREQRIHYMFPSMVPRAQADPQWIGQVLVNLIHNAGKYTDVGGTIDIAVTENEHYLVLSVSDNGAGLPDRRPDVFEPFVQGDPQGSAGSEGTGLGLAIVKRVIALHGGEVYVASRQDGGTTVSVTLKKAGSHG